MKRALLVIACSATASAETRPGYDGRIEAPLIGAPATLDPVTAQSHAELTVAELVFDTLYRLEGNKPEPHLAIGMPNLNATNTIARIEIRKRVQFHNGTFLTPTDVAASIDRARIGVGRWALAPILSVKANGNSIEIELRAAGVDVATMLALAPAAITPQGKAPGSKPIGSGPYKFGSIDRANGKLVLDAFEEHFAGRTYLHHLTLRWHATPDAEAKRFELDHAQLSTRGQSVFVGGQSKFKANAVDAPKSVLVFVGFGKKQAAVTSDPAFRRALDFAIDRNALASVNHGEAVLPAGEPLPVEAGGQQPTVLARFGDLVEAKKHLATAATRVTQLTQANLPKLTLEIAFEDTRPDDREIAERVGRALGKLGIGATLTGLSAVDLRDRVQRGTTDLWIGQLAAPISTPWVWWTAAFTAGGDDWATNKVAAGQLTAASVRIEYVKRRPILPLVFRGIRMWHRSDVRGLRFDATGRPCFAELFVFGAPVKAKVP